MNPAHHSFTFQTVDSIMNKLDRLIKIKLGVFSFFIASSLPSVAATITKDFTWETEDWKIHGFSYKIQGSFSYDEVALNDYYLTRKELKDFSVKVIEPEEKGSYKGDLEALGTMGLDALTFFEYEIFNPNETDRLSETKLFNFASVKFFDSANSVLKGISFRYQDSRKVSSADGTLGSSLAYIFASQGRGGYTNIGGASFYSDSSFVPLSVVNTVTPSTTVPEPRTAAVLMFLGLGGCFLVKRK
jgi:hypothetical protein